MDYAERLTRTRIHFRPTLKWIDLIFITSISLAICYLSEDVSTGSLEISSILTSILSAPMYPVLLFLMMKWKLASIGISIRLDDEIGKIKWSEIKKLFFYNLFILFCINFIVTVFNPEDFTLITSIVRTIIFSLYYSILYAKTFQNL